ncbi:MAG: hypothetical protein ACXWPS_01970, partial [Ktedonobacteraceae bacterium]
MTSLKRVQSLYNETITAINKAIAKVSIAQSRPIPLQRGPCENGLLQIYHYSGTSEAGQNPWKCPWNPPHRWQTSCPSRPNVTCYTHLTALCKPSIRNEKRMKYPYHSTDPQEGPTPQQIAAWSLILRQWQSRLAPYFARPEAATLHADFPRFRRVLQQAVLVEFEEHRRAGARLNPDGDLPDALGANGRWYTD